MATEIWRGFDPNLDIPDGLKNAYESVSRDRVDEYPDPDADIDSQTDTLSDDESQLDEEEADDELGVPGSFKIISQTVRTGPGGAQFVDIVIDVEEVEGAVKYEVRVTKAKK